MVLYNVLTNLPPLLALSLFIAVLMTLMRSWQDNEMIVWFSSGGRSLLSWIGPVLRFAVPVVLAIALLSIVISPWATSQTDSARNEFANRDEVNQLSPGRFIESLNGRRIFFVESQGKNSNEVGRVFVAETTSKGMATITAESGTLEVNPEGDRYVVLHNGRRVEINSGSPETRVVQFKDYGTRIDVKLDKRLDSMKAAAQPMTTLLAGGTPEQQGEIFWRLSWPLSALLLALFAVPLSASNPRAGRSFNLIIAALVFILYLNGISIMQTWIEQKKFTYMSGLFILHGAVLLLCVIFYIRRVFMQRWLPVWMTPWYWSHQRGRSKGEG
jgi:lipopolysaccharide export system permease protein